MALDSVVVNRIIWYDIWWSIRKLVIISFIGFESIKLIAVDSIVGSIVFVKSVNMEGVVLNDCK